MTAINIMEQRQGKHELPREDSKQSVSKSLTFDRLGWRGFGGALATIDSVLFDRQLDKISIWLDKWTHQQCYSLVETLLRRSSYKQQQFVRTVVQPALHRDFMYTASKHYPSRKFVPISTTTSRDKKDKLKQSRKKHFHRISSAHLQFYRQVQELNQDCESCEVPHVPEDKDRVNASSLSEENQDISLIKSNSVLSKSSLVRSHTRSTAKSRTSSQRMRVHFPQLSGQSSTPSSCMSLVSSTSSQRDQSKPMLNTQRLSSSLDILHTSPPCLRDFSGLVDVPVRRHIQEEESPRRYPELSDLSSLSSPSSQRSQQNLRRKGKRTRKPHKYPQAVQHDMPNIPKDGWHVLQWYLEDWNDQQRNEFLHKLLLKLDPRQHYFMSSFLSLQEYRDMITLLPENIALGILSYLTPFDIGNASRVCKIWYQRCNHNILWQMKCKQTIIEIPINNPDPDWKNIYKKNKSVKSNWKQGRCDVIDCTGHTDRVLSVIFDEKRLATGSADRTIRLWSLRDGRCVRTLTGHNKGVWCLCFFTKSLLISGSYDSTIKVWNMRNGICNRTLLSHQGPVWAIIRQQQLLASASQDKTAKIWDISRCVLLHTLRGHTGPVFCVDMDMERYVVITGSSDKTVKLWSVDSGEELKSVHVSNSTSVMAVSYNQGFFACSFAETILLYAWDGESAKKVRSFEEHKKRIETLRLTIKDANKLEGLIISAGKDAELKYWNIAKRKSKHTFLGHEEPINCIHCDDTRIATASYDNRVKIWDFGIS